MRRAGIRSSSRWTSLTCFPALRRESGNGGPCGPRRRDIRLRLFRSATKTSRCQSEIRTPRESTAIDRSRSCLAQVRLGVAAGVAGALEAAPAAKPRLHPPGVDLDEGLYPQQVLARRAGLAQGVAGVVAEPAQAPRRGERGASMRTPSRARNSWEASAPGPPRAMRSRRSASAPSGPAPGPYTAGSSQCRAAHGPVKGRREGVVRSVIGSLPDGRAKGRRPAGREAVRVWKDGWTAGGARAAGRRNGRRALTPPGEPRRASTIPEATRAADSGGGDGAICRIRCDGTVRPTGLRAV